MSSDTASAAKQLQKDLNKLVRDPPLGVSAYPNDGDILTWNALVYGPDDTPFEGGMFRLRLQFSAAYPNQAPKVWFYSKMFHPNVYKDGKICLDILEEPAKWDSNYDVGAVLCAIQAMLGDPNPNSPANGEANGLFLRELENYKKKVKEIVELSVRRIDYDDDEDEIVNQNFNPDNFDEDISLAASLDEFVRLDENEESEKD